MKCKEVMTHVLFDTLPNWMKYRQHEKDVRIVRKVYSIGDLCYTNEYDQRSSDMSTPRFEKLKRHLSSSSNLTSNNRPILTSTLGKLLVRKLTHRSTADVTRSALDLCRGQNCAREDSPTMDNNMIGNDCIRFIERIGQGKLGIVYKACYQTKQNESITVAVKKLDRKFTYEDISEDVDVLQEIQHPHVIQFFAVSIHTDGAVMFIMEYAHGKSLDECLIVPNAKEVYSVQILLEFIKQITSALSYLEKRFFIHRNLTCRNYLVFDKALAKLSDWSFGHRNASWKERLKLPIAWMSPEAINSHCFSIASDVFSFGVSMWECFSYGQVPWEGMTNDEILEAIDAPHYQQLPRPSHASSALYEIMLRCWKYAPSERPTFSELETALAEMDLTQVQWNAQHSTSINLPDGFLSCQSCLLGPLTILDRCLDIPSSSSSLKNLIHCVAVDGQTGFVHNSDVEPFHALTLSEQTTTMNHMFSRKAGIKKNSTKTRCKQISKDMISSPQADFIHAFHLGVEGEVFGDMSCLTNVEKPDLSVQLHAKNAAISLVEQRSDNEPSSSLFDEVMQAFTEIYSETESASLSEEQQVTRSTSPSSVTMNIQSTSFDINQFPSDDMTDSSHRSSPPFSRLLTKLTVKKPNDTSCRFTRELEERSRNGNLTEQGKCAYNLLIDRCTSDSSAPSSTPDDQSSSASSNHEKSDYRSQYSSRSSLNSHASSLLKIEQAQHSATGQPLPPPPDLATLGSKLTTANMTNTFNLPASLISNRHPTKRRFHLFT